MTECHEEEDEEPDPARGAGVLFQDFNQFLASFRARDRPRVTGDDSEAIF